MSRAMVRTVIDLFSILVVAPYSCNTGDLPCKRGYERDENKSLPSSRSGETELNDSDHKQTNRTNYTSSGSLYAHRLFRGHGIESIERDHSTVEEHIRSGGHHALYEHQLALSLKTASGTHTTAPVIQVSIDLRLMPLKSSKLGSSMPLMTNCSNGQ